MNPYSTDTFDISCPARAGDDTGEFRERFRFGHDVDHVIESIDDLRKFDDADIDVRYRFNDTTVDVVLHLDNGAQVGDAVIGFGNAAFVVRGILAEGIL